MYLSEQFSIKDRLLMSMATDDFSGYDPFDGLNSRLFNKLKLDRSEFLRLAWLQFHKRFPFNVRPLVGVPKKRNPKGVALVISGLLEDYHRAGSDKYLEQAMKLGDWLIDNRSDPSKWPHYSWGYHFPWQARAFYVPAGKPNIITTCYAARALYSLHEATDDRRYQDAAIDAGQFMGSLFSQENNRNYFVYIPGETAFVHNASLWGAALAARAASITDNSGLMTKARLAVEQSVNEQATDGSWVYGERKHHQFIDGFHTGYNLEAIWWYQQHSGDKRFTDSLENGLAYYRNHFFLADGTPKYYQNNVYPIDMHSAAQAVFTLVRVGGQAKDYEFVEKILGWSIANMFLPKKGCFRYQKKPWLNNDICYMRWTQAWMYYALSYWQRIKGESS